MTYKSRKIIILIGDFLILWGSLVLTLCLRYGQSDFLKQYQVHWPRFIFIFIILLLSLYINHLYNLNISPRSSKFLRQFLNSLLLAGIISIIYFYISIASSVAPKTNLFIFFALFSFLFYCWRLLSLPLQKSLGKTGVAILYDNELTTKIKQIIAQNPALAYQVELVINDELSLSQAQQLAQADKLKLIIISGDFNLEAELRPDLMQFLQYNVSFLSYADFLELTQKKVPVTNLEITWFLNNLREENRRAYQIIKRSSDLILASLFLIISLIFWPLLALAIKLDDKGPVFFSQERLGYRAKVFKIKKFRTMRVEDNDQGITIKNDKRITKVGAVLRATRLDELPQLLNIIRGEMSFIGPRPERPELVNELEKLVPFYSIRTMVKPGLSGWDQVSGEYHSATKEDTIKKLENDLYYLKNRSFFLDAIIILKTIGTILGRGGR